MTDKNIQEAKVGSGTALADKSAEKRAQISLKLIQLRMKQNKEREALANQKKALKTEETMTESFSASQIAKLKAEYSKINTIDPSSDTYKKLIAMLDRLDLKSLQSLAGAEVKFVSKLAQNRVARKNMKEDVQLDELSTDKLADYKKKAGADATAADKAGDTKKGNKRFSGIMKATRKQFDNDAKGEKNEELSPKQKEIDKNKNGKIDGFDLAAIRNKKKPQGADFAAQRRKERLASNGRMDEGKTDYEVYHKDYSGAVQTAIKQAEKRGFEVDMDDWHDKVATGPKKPSAGKTNSFSVKLKKDGKESKKALHLQVYNMDNHKYELNMYIEEIQLDELNKDTLHSYANKSEKDQDDQYNKIGKGIRDNDPKSANKAGHKFSMRSIGQNRAEKRLAKEAASPAHQAAIAIAMKKAGKKPKDMEESDAYDKDVKPSDKPHDKEAAANRAKQAALAARKKMSEGLMDKIKAIKRGLEAKDKADDHFDKAGDPKNANASKDLKKAVRYHNLLNKEENGIQANPVTKHVTKGEVTKSGVAKWLAEPLKKEEAVPEFKQGGSELAKKFNKAFKSVGVDAKVKIKTVGNVSANEEVVFEAKKPKSFKDVKKKMKEEEKPNKSTIQKGDDLTGKKEPIEVNPELKESKNNE
jgi:hypothetical protein